MPLLDLKTNLKSLKYGSDRPGGGNSGQPYQQVDINKVDTGFNRFRMTKFDDGLVRGGVVGATNASIVDTFRIGKFLKDLPKGPLFIAKQVGLQLSNPKIETSKSGRGNVGKLGPTRVYNLGINTLAQIPVNAFGGHFERHGLSPVQDDQTKYLKVAQENNNEKDNKLIKLTTRFGLGVVDSDTPKSQVFLRKSELKSITSAGGTSAMLLKANDIQSSKIDDYTGGPSSVYGIGRTLIRRTPEYTNDNLKITNALNRAFNSQHLPEVKISSSFDFGISLTTGSALAKRDFDLITDTGINVNESFLNYDVVNNYVNNLQQVKDNRSLSYTDATEGVRSNRFVGVSFKDSSSLAALKFNNGSPLSANTFNQPASLNDNTINTFVSPSRPNTTGSRVVSSSAALGISDITKDTTIPNYNNVITYTSNDPVTKYTQLRTQIDNKSSGKTTGFASVSSKISKSGLGSKAIKALSSLQSNRSNDKNVDEDTMAIKIVPIDAFNGNSIETLRFLAYLTSYSDSYTSGWNDVKYAGRSEKFYIFTDFKRSVNIEFNIPCFNEDELIEKHAELNKLVSILAGQYNNNFLGGVISKITLGNYLVNQPGIIENLNYSPLPDSSWDIDARLAQYIKVSFGFTVIHNFLPEYGQSFIFVNGAQSAYAAAKQKQLQIEEENAAIRESFQRTVRADNERIRAGNLDPSEVPPEVLNEINPENIATVRARPNALDSASNTIPNSKIESVKNLQFQVAKQQQVAKKTAAVQARKSVGKSVPKKEEEKPVKIGGMPIPYPKETQFNALIGGIKPSQNSPYSTANQLENSKALAQAEKQATQAFLNKAGVYKKG
jgi:hypothetical protein